MTNRSRVAAGLLASAAAATILVGCGSSGDTASTSAAASSTATTGTSTGTANTSELRDSRYCEIIPVTRDGKTLTSSVYNTTGLNDCPEDVWETITPQSVAKQYKAIQVKMNGPRYWTLDSIEASGDSNTDTIYTFGTAPNTLQTYKRATIQTEVGQPTVGDEDYVPNSVKRDTSFLFKAGEPVFELTDPDGNVYMMQSYATYVDTGLTYEQLPDLGSKLQLPSGWKYSTRTLTDDYTLSTASTDGVAYVVNDNFDNSYQRRS